MAIEISRYIMIYPDISSFCWWTSFFFVILSHPFVARCCKSWLYMNWWLSNDLVRQFWQCQILLFWQLCLFVNYMYVLTRPFTMHYVTLCINMHFFTGFFLKRSSCLLSSAVAATHPWFIGLCLNLWGPPNPVVHCQDIAKRQVEIYSGPTRVSS
jgi:hypothetical protein